MVFCFTASKDGDGLQHNEFFTVITGIKSMVCICVSTGAAGNSDDIILTDVKKKLSQ